MRESLIRHFEPLTEEERALLAMPPDAAAFEPARYSSQGSFTFESKTVMQRAGSLIDIRPHTRFVHFPKHRHDYIEVLFMLRGSTTHIVNDVHTVTLKAGDLLFLNQVADHEILPAGKDDIGVNFIILPAFFDFSFGILEGDNALSRFLVSTLSSGKNTSDYLYFQVADVLPVQNLLENLVYALVERRDDDRLNRMTMGLLLLELLQCSEALESGSEDTYRHSLAMQVLKYIDRHYQKASLTELCRDLNQSPSGLSKLVREQTGKTFSELLLDKRLSRARELIEHSTLPITEIIHLVGYENTSYFYRTFSEKFGQSPREIRTSGSETSEAGGSAAGQYTRS